MTQVQVKIATRQTEPQPNPSRRWVGWRGRHMYGEDGRPAGVTASMPYPPAVIPPATPTVALPMTREIQLMSYELMKQFCTGLTKTRWRTAHTWDFAMNNGGQNGYDGGTALADYVNNRDLDARLPRYDKMQRIFQGSFITGILNGNYITCRPGIDAIDSRRPLPPIQEILDRRWYVIATAVGNPPFYVRGHWGGYLVYPFILDRDVSYESRFFVRWEEDYPPNPLTIYLA